jgi:rare lipoprotein A
MTWHAAWPTVLLRWLLLSLMVVVLAACSSSRPGGYYKDDGPPRRVPSNMDKIPDAVPRIEPLARGPTRPYTVMGKRYVPDTSDRPYRVRGIASWYGRKFHGNPTANGERYDMFAMTAAHTTLPIPSYVRVTRVSNGRSVIVRINDRGPFLHNRVIDLSYAAAYRLDMVASGSAEVIVERITPQEIRSGSWRKGSKASTQTPEPAPTPAPAATQWAPSVAASGPVYLQLGAFQEEANARALAARAAGDTSMRLPVEVDQNAARVFRVRVGPFRSREQALEASGSIERNLGITPSLSLP